MPKSDEQKAVSVYMPLELYQQLIEFKNQENLRSNSQAINLLVERCLDGSTTPDTSKAPYQRLRQLEETISDIASRLKQVEGTLVTKVTNVPNNVPDIVKSTGDNTVLSESPKLVVCKLYKNAAKDPQFWRYWAGAKFGFVEDLNKAKTYTEKDASKVINQLLEDEIHKPTSRERISCRALEELTALGANYEKVC